MAYTFPEDEFPAAAHLAAAYRGRVEAGYAVARGSAAAICALARDLGAGVDRLRATVAAIGALFAGYTAVVVENDSADDTRARLERWDADDPRLVLCTGDLGRPRWPAVRSGERGTQMAEYRNRYRDLVVIAGGVDYVVVIDGDLAGHSLDGIASTLGSGGWDAMGGSGLRAVRGRVVQYDVWAWRDVGHPAAHDARAINHRVYDRGHPPIPVLSCFGGVAVYRAAALAAARYAGGDCEHVPLHRAMAASGFPRIFHNPGMIAVYPP